MKTQRGQSTVELVLLMPLLLVLLFLIFEVGRFFGSWLLVTNAAREGARYAAVQCVPNWQTAVGSTCAITACAASDPGPLIATRAQQTAQFLVVPTTPCAQSGNGETLGSVSVAYISGGLVTVTVTYQLQTLMPINVRVPFLGTLNYPGSSQVTATSSMRLEQGQ
jgi:Flp pilus assembly protein TadG